MDQENEESRCFGVLTCALIEFYGLTHDRRQPAFRPSPTHLDSYLPSIKMYKQASTSRLPATTGTTEFDILKASHK